MPRTFEPDPTAIPMTDEQIIDMIKAFYYIKEQTGYGTITIVIQNGHVRFLKYEVSQELSFKQVIKVINKEQTQ